MTITNTGIAVAVAVVIGLAFLFFGPQLLTSFGAVQPTTTTTMNDQNTGAAAAPTPDAQNPAAGAVAPITQLRVNDIKVGTGAEAAAGDTVTVEYVGALTDGTVFDSSKSHGQPFTFMLGAGKVIPGWDQGLVGMKEGGQRVLAIPASLGYGAQANGPIPANSALIFEVDLVKVQKGAK